MNHAYRAMTLRGLWATAIGGIVIMIIVAIATGGN
jgi:hypothetical protein